MTKTIRRGRIYMFWHKVPFGKKNFGDVLGPYLVEHLSGLKPIYTPLLHTGLTKACILTYLRALYNRKLSLKELYYNMQYIMGGNNTILITIGSVIDWYTNPNCDIWGSGIMFRQSKITKANFCAVRGKYSQLRLKELGYKAAEAIGDPALLMPLVYKPKSEKKYKLGIIPHFLHYDETVAKLSSNDILIINLFDPIEKVIEDVNSCENIVSSSLHGIIIAHAYHIPALWVNLASDHIGGDDIKFADYFSSVEIVEYDQFRIDLPGYDDKYKAEVALMFNENKQLAGASDGVIEKIQRNLIKSAPFPILPQFKELI